MLVCHNRMAHHGIQNNSKALAIFSIHSHGVSELRYTDIKKITIIISINQTTPIIVIANQVFLSI